MSGTASIILAVVALLFKGNIPAWAFATVGVACVFVACFQAWKDERLELEKVQQANQALQDRIDGFPALRVDKGSVSAWYAAAKVKPNFAFRDPEDPFEGVTTESSQLVIVLSVEFANEPHRITNESSARNVVATVEYYESGTARPLAQTSGIWYERPTKQEGVPLPAIELSSESPDSVHLLPGQKRTLLIALRTNDGTSTNALDHTPQYHPNKLAHQLTGDDFRAVVRLRCPHFDQRWEILFRNSTVGARAVLEPLMCAALA